MPDLDSAKKKCIPAAILWFAFPVGMMMGIMMIFLGTGIIPGLPTIYPMITVMMASVGFSIGFVPRFVSEILHWTIMKDMDPMNFSAGVDEGKHKTGKNLFMFQWIGSIVMYGGLLLLAFTLAPFISTIMGSGWNPMLMAFIPVLLIGLLALLGGTALTIIGLIGLIFFGIYVFGIGENARVPVLQAAGILQIIVTPIGLILTFVGLNKL